MPHHFREKDTHVCHIRNIDSEIESLDIHIPCIQLILSWIHIAQSLRTVTSPRFLQVKISRTSLTVNMVNALYSWCSILFMCRPTYIYKKLTQTFESVYRTSEIWKLLVLIKISLVPGNRILGIFSPCTRHMERYYGIIHVSS